MTPELLNTITLFNREYDRATQKNTDSFSKINQTAFHSNNFNLKLLFLQVGKIWGLIQKNHPQDTIDKAIDELTDLIKQQTTTYKEQVKAIEASMIQLRNTLVKLIRQCEVECAEDELSKYLQPLIQKSNMLDKGISMSCAHLLKHYKLWTEYQLQISEIFSVPQTISVNHNRSHDLGLQYMESAEYAGSTPNGLMECLNMHKDQKCGMAFEGRWVVEGFFKQIGFTSPTKPEIGYQPFYLPPEGFINKNEDMQAPPSRKFSII